MRHIIIITIIAIALTSALLIDGRGQKPSPGSQVPRPESAKQVALEKTITTQQRINRYFHGETVSKLRNCWSQLQGKGTIAFKYTYSKANGKWTFEKLEVERTTLPRGQDTVALKCMQDSVRSTSFPAEEGEGRENSFVLHWSWPVPFPANAEEQTSAMFAARAAGGGGGGGGCDGHGTEPACFNCDGSLSSCIKVCVGYDTCSLRAHGIVQCTVSGKCASGSPFGVASGGLFAY